MFVIKNTPGFVQTTVHNPQIFCLQQNKTDKSENTCKALAKAHVPNNCKNARVDQIPALGTRYSASCH